MHTTHHLLGASLPTQRIPASTPADKSMSEFTDAERAEAGGVCYRCRVRSFPSSRPSMLRPHRRLGLPLVLLVAIAMFACQPSSGSQVDPARRRAIADTLSGMIRSAYDLKAKDVVAGLMSLYPDSGRVISASGGRVTTTRDSLAAGIKSFYEYVGRNMQDPTWKWGTPFVDVLSPDAAVVTTTYRVPHRTPAGEPHTIAGAWTAVFARRGGKWVIIQEHLSEIPPEVMEGDTADVPMAGHKH